jgi:hypothetical protein
MDQDEFQSTYSFTLIIFSGEYHDYPSDVRIFLYSLLLVDGYEVHINDESYRELVKKMGERFLNDTPTRELDPTDLPKDIVIIDENVVAFRSKSIQNDIMYAFVTECLVRENDLLFFLEIASKHVISEYCRSFWHKKDGNERCIFLPEWPQETYNQQFIDRLGIGIITHCRVIDEKMQDLICKRCKYDYRSIN